MEMLKARDDIEIIECDSLDENVIAEAAKDVRHDGSRCDDYTQNYVTGSDLMVVSRHGVGYDAVDLNTLNERNIPLCIAIHSNMISVAEQAMALLLGLAKDIFYYDEVTRTTDWDPDFDCAVDLDGKPLIIGFGRIGRQVAKELWVLILKHLDTTHTLMIQF